eukprot:gene21355-25665_t
MERSRRNASRANKAKSSIEELKAFREKSRTDRYDTKDEEDVYDVVDEKEYRKLVEKRRDEGGAFVVNDDGIGYADMGEEEDWTAAPCEDGEKQEDDLTDKSRKRKGDAKEAAPAKAKKRPEIVPGAAQRMQTMFAKAKAGSVKRQPVADTCQADSLLEDILADLGPDDRDRDRLRRGGGVRPGEPTSSASRQPVPASGRFAPTLRSAPVAASVPSHAAADLMEEDAGPIAGSLEDDLPGGDAFADMETADEQPAVVDCPVATDTEACKLEVETEVPLEKPSEPAAAAVSEPSLKTPAGPPVNAPLSGCHAVWEAGAGEEEAPITSVPVSSSQGGLPLDEDGSVPFYYMEAFEDVASPGKAFLFGKMPVSGAAATYQSACCIVTDLERCVFAVPTAGTFEDSKVATLEEAAASGDAKSKALLMRHLQALAKDLKEEVRGLLLERGVTSFSMVPVKRAYAFERTDVSRAEQYVLKTSALEALLLKRKIMGPSWLCVRDAVVASSQMSWCKVEMTVSGHKTISHPQQQSDPPPVTVAALNLKTVINKGHNVNEVIAASVLWVQRVKVDGPMTREEWSNPKQLRHVTVVRKLDGTTFPPGWDEHTNAKAGKGAVVLSSQSSERALLSFLLARLQQIDADILVGHNIGGFDLDVLLHRLQANKVPHWSRLGRLRRTKMPNLNGGGGQFGGGAGAGALSCLAGRLLCDTYLSAREFVKEVSYSLTSLAKSQLMINRDELEASEIPERFMSGVGIQSVVTHAESDAWLSLVLMFHLSVIPLSRQLTCLTGSLWGKTLQGARALRIEFLLLHEFHARKFVVPDKLSFKERERISKTAAIAE